MDVHSHVTERIDALLAGFRRVQFSNAVEALRISEEVLTLALSAGDRSRLIRAYNCRSQALNVNDRYPAALEMLEKGRAICDEHEDPAEMARLLITEAAVRRKQGAHREVFDLMAMAVDLAERAGEELLTATALRGIGASYGALGKYALHSEYMFRALEIWERVDPSQDGAALHGIGPMFDMLKQWDKAHEYFARALKAARETEDRRGEAMTLGGIGLIHERKEEFDVALHYYQEGLRIAREGSFRHTEIYQLVAVGRILEDVGRRAEAMEHVQEGLRIARETGAADWEFAIIRLIAWVYIDEGRYQEAIDITLSGRERFGSFNDDFFTLRFHRIMAAAYEKGGDLPLAVEHLKSIIKYHEGNVALELPKTLLLLEERMGLKAVERERDTLREQQAVLEHELKYKNRDLSTMSLMLRQREEALAILRQQIGRASADNASVDDALAQEPTEVEPPAMADQLWTDFGRQIDTIHADFIHLLVNRYPRLTPTDLKICSLLKLNLTTKEIARLMGLAPKSVEIYRTRIRKRLGLRGEDNLRAVLESF